MNKVLAWGVVIVWIGLIYSMTFTPGSDSAALSMGFVLRVETVLEFFSINIERDTLHGLVRKGAHLGVYFFLGIWLINALSYHTIKPKVRFFVGLGCALLVASLDETFQLFVEGRHGSIIDVIIDMIGAIMGSSLMLYLKMKLLK